MENRTKYIMAACLGGLLCFGVGFASGQGNRNQGQTTALASQNRLSAQENTDQEKDFAPGNQDETLSPEADRDFGGFEREENREGFGGQPMLGDLSQLYESLDEEDQKTLQKLLSLSHNELLSLDEEKVQELMKTFTALSEEDQRTILEILHSLHEQKMGGRGRGFGQGAFGFDGEEGDFDFGMRSGEDFRIGEDARSGATQEAETNKNQSSGSGQRV